ncbi:hypothetical protein LWI29_011607 [Acer saccharum]|uniref:S-locus glycoprotein domain-containing protein n=1 Tax=Acer saccharum TaxID=4024 RepID=A0AA39W1D4_ACESA|nr:hypothetical protein LWI29_011607 [Acer saccharum]
MWKGSNKFFRRGPWNGITYGGALESVHNSIFEVNFVNNEDELYYAFKMIDKSMFSMFVLNKTRSLLELLTWSQTTQNWNVYSYVPRDQCDSYGLCGVYGNCITTQFPICQCLEGFKPKSTGYRNWSQGCVRNKALNYSKLDGYQIYWVEIAGCYKFLGEQKYESRAMQGEMFREHFLYGILKLGY